MSTEAGIRWMGPEAKGCVLPFSAEDSRRLPQRPGIEEDLLGVLCLYTDAGFGHSLLVH